MKHVAKSAILCNCGHRKDMHFYGDGNCGAIVDHLVDPLMSGANWKTCPCPRFDDAKLPDLGERPVFGVHRQPAVDAETAEAWPPVPTWAARVKAATTRRMKRV